MFSFRFSLYSLYCKDVTADRLRWIWVTQWPSMGLLLRCSGQDLEPLDAENREREVTTAKRYLPMASVGVLNEGGNSIILQSFQRGESHRCLHGWNAETLQRWRRTFEVDQKGGLKKKKEAEEVWEVRSWRSDNAMRWRKRFIERSRRWLLFK